MKKLILTLTVIFAHLCSYSKIIYVSRDATGFNDGTSWTDAFNNFQDALDASSPTQTDTVWVKSGTYYPDREKNGVPGQGNPTDWMFYSTHPVWIYGGFAGHEKMLTQRNWETNPTILDGDIGIPGVAADNAACIAFLGNGSHALMDGFTIQNAFSNKTGGGLTVGNLNCVFLKNIRIQDCYSAGSGAGLTLFDLRGGEINNVVCSNNSADRKGGGFFLSRLSRVRFTKVFALQNMAELGGGMFADSLDNVVMDGMFFCGNTALLDGGGLFANSFSTVDMVNQTYNENVALRNGGGAFFQAFENVNLSNITCIFNIAAGIYGGLGIKSASNLKLYNSIFWENSDTNGSLHQSSQIFRTQAVLDLEARYTIIEGSHGSGSSWNSSLEDLGNNLDIDPDFSDTYGLDTLPCTLDDDYTPKITSPVIDAGTTHAPGIGALDANGKPRIAGGQVDLGACESQTSFPVEWLSFKGKYEQGNVVLNWLTASERNSDHFVVQRLQEEYQNWSNVGKLKARGESQVPSNYQFVDGLVPSGQTIRYRIKQVDKDGTENFSSEVEISTWVRDPSTKINVYPNPTNDVLNIDFQEFNSEGEISVKLINQLGVVVNHNKYNSLMNNRLRLDLSQLPSGFYTLTVNAGNTQRRTNIFKE
ncbi:MAG: T9SS type A sorting domain-containing protein [Bacteroidia bacterium]|nr:T9SS type A sorting domain-containing protein [Bacteroidia bacterium]